MVLADYTSVILRFGEMGIKSNQTRRRMKKLLIGQVESALRENGVKFEKVHSVYGRIYIETKNAIEAAEVAAKVFGIVSTSPVVETSAEMDEILNAGEQLVRAEFKKGLTFAVGARRIGEHPFSSQDVREQLGERIFEGMPELEPKVDLSNPEQEVYVEVRDGKAHLFTRTIKGVGGMPTGSQGKVVCTISTGLDSPIAAYKVMKRGCIPVFVHLDNTPYADENCSEIAVKQAQLLANYIHGFEVKLYIVPHAPDIEEAKKHAPEKMTCLFCKRNMLRIAREIAILEDADAIITGEIIGEQASQTTANLRVIENAVTDYPILRPNAGDDKVDIEHLAQEIGTYEFAKEGASCCTLNPKYPSVRADPEQVAACEEPMDLSILSEELKNARIITLREGK
ncbi:MAG: tRNA uracil 4-sulfurtransferase ThiI [Candidatus Thorarchaeota archaeon]|jgi:thiamine biosynthesis protein ThiI